MDQLNIEKICNTTLKDKYKIKKKIKTGGFGSVYIAEDLKRKELVAIKIMKKQNQQFAQIQHNIYKKLQAEQYTYGFVKFYEKISDKDCSILIMELLDKDLQDLMYNQKVRPALFSLKTVLMIGLQMIDRIQVIHKLGYLHRDIKPDNMVAGVREKNKVIYLIDFGLVKGIKQVRKHEKGKLVGSLAYMSCRTHEGKDQCLMDDIEGLMYSMIFLANGQLPWMKIKIKSIADAHKIYMMKKNFSLTELKNQKVPQKLFKMLKQAQTANTNLKPEYLKIKYKFLEMLNDLKKQNDFHFDWIKDQKMQKLEKQAQLRPQLKKKTKNQQMKQQNQKIVQKQIFQVYKFLDEESESKKQPTKQKLQNQNKKNIKNQPKQRPISSTKKNAPFSQQKNRNSQQKLQTYKNKDMQLRQKIQMLNNFKVSGPQIVINKTAKHKI